MDKLNRIWEKLERYKRLDKQEIVINWAFFHRALLIIEAELSPKWTKRKPRKEGWYWLRLKGAGLNNPGTRIFQILKNPEMGLFAYGFGLIKKLNGYEFAGPIPFPEPPKGE